MTGARPVTTRAGDLTWHGEQAPPPVTTEVILAEWHENTDGLAGPHLNRAAAALHAGDHMGAAEELELAAACHGDGETGDRLCRMAISLARTGGHLEMAADAWRHEHRGAHGEWVKAGAMTSSKDWEPHRKELLALARHEKEAAGSMEPRRDRVLERMAAIQGFDAKPDKGPLDPGRPTLYRGFGDRYDQGNGRELAGQFTDGPNYGSTGQHGNGAYFTSDQHRAEGYGHVLPAQLHPQARVATEDELWGQLDSLPADWKEIIGDDVGKLAVMRGYDAVKPKGTSVIVVNRGALRVPAPGAAS